MKKTRGPKQGLKDVRRILELVTHFTIPALLQAPRRKASRTRGRGDSHCHGRFLAVGMPTLYFRHRTHERATATEPSYVPYYSISSRFAQKSQRSDPFLVLDLPGNVAPFSLFWCAPLG